MRKGFACFHFNHAFVEICTNLCADTQCKLPEISYLYLSEFVNVVNKKFVE